MKRIFLLLIAALFVQVWALSPTFAQSKKAKQKNEKQKVISPNQAARAAQRQGKGKVLSNTLVKPKQGRPYYRVKTLNNGKVRVHRVDAYSGRSK